MSHIDRFNSKVLVFLSNAWIQGYSIIGHCLKNILSILPGIMTLRRYFLGSPFGETKIISNQWILRRTGQIDQILAAFKIAFVDFRWLSGKSVLEIGSGVDCSIPYSFCVLGATVGHASDVGCNEDFSIAQNMIMEIKKPFLNTQIKMYLYQVILL